ncbi:hypothetical protein [Massilia putida]|uniref:hypothetical protein n=1 Tax=Massilia putida TaxID=1141883 RepID=UPI000950BD4D|nr:hypothetical protein [Massilia putida]
MSDYTGGDLDLRGLRRGAYVIVGGIACALVAGALMLREEGPAANTPPHAFQGATPLLQPAPQPDRVSYLEEKRRVLAGYGWVDRQAGIARIPLDEAMKLMAAQGGATPAPAAKPAPATKAGRTPPILASGKEAR